MPEKLTNDLFSLAFQAPFVIALRCQRLAAGVWPGSSKHTAELHRMVNEKAEASIESLISWNTVLTRMSLAFFQEVWLGRRPGLSPRQGTELIGKTVRPFAKRVRANSRRLSRN